MTTHKHTLPREVSPGVFWIGDCLVQRTRGKVYHGYNAAYVVAGETASCLLDTGAPKDFLVIDNHINQLLAKGIPPLKYLMLSHAETPHAGGLARVMAKYPDVILCGDVSDYHLAFPQFAHRLLSLEVGDEIDLGGRKLLMCEPVIRDLRSSLWAFDTLGHVLFPADGFAYSHYHLDGHCGLLAEEAISLDLKDVSAVFSERALFWTKFVDMNVYINELRALIKKLDVRFICPTHGLPISDVARTVPKVEEGLLFAGQEEMSPQGDLAQAALTGSMKEPGLVAGE